MGCPNVLGFYTQFRLPKFISHYLEFITLAEFKELFRDL